jgi:hypothetical protein
MKVTKKTTSHQGRLPVDHPTDLPQPIIGDCIEVRTDTPEEPIVTATGHLSGDLEYCLKTFTLLGRGETLFMLAAEVARLTGYRDSYLLFLRNRTLRKIVTTRAERDDLLQRGVIPFPYRYRHISVVTARSVFMQFGHRVILHDQRIQDAAEDNIISPTEPPHTPTKAQPEATSNITAIGTSKTPLSSYHQPVAKSHVNYILAPGKPGQTYPDSQTVFDKPVTYNLPVEPSSAIETIRQEAETSPPEPLHLPSIRELFGSPQGPMAALFRSRDYPRPQARVFEPRFRGSHLNPALLTF